VDRKMMEENERMQGPKRRYNQFLFMDFSDGNSKEAGSGSGIRDDQSGSYSLELRNSFWG
jgi:hypothetical protein